MLFAHLFMVFNLYRYYRLTYGAWNSYYLVFQGWFLGMYLVTICLVNHRPYCYHGPHGWLFWCISFAWMIILGAFLLSFFLTGRLALGKIEPIHWSTLTWHVYESFLRSCGLMSQQMWQESSLEEGYWQRSQYWWDRWGRIFVCANKWWWLNLLGEMLFIYLWFMFAAGIWGVDKYEIMLLNWSRTVIWYNWVDIIGWVGCGLWMSNSLGVWLGVRLLGTLEREELSLLSALEQWGYTHYLDRYAYNAADQHLDVWEGFRDDWTWVFKFNESHNNLYDLSPYVNSWRDEGIDSFNSGYGQFSRSFLMEAFSEYCYQPARYFNSAIIYNSMLLPRDEVQLGYVAEGQFNSGIWESEVDIYYNHFFEQWDTDFNLTWRGGWGGLLVWIQGGQMPLHVRYLFRALGCGQ